MGWLTSLKDFLAFKFSHTTDRKTIVRLHKVN